VSADGDQPGLEQWARAVADGRGIELREEMRRTTYAESDRLRNLMYDARFEGRPAVLKLYDDEVINVEAESLRQWHAVNRSAMLGAPELFADEIVSLTRGWLLIEKLPGDGRFLESPLSEQERERFLDVFVEYRANFPRSPNRPLALAERHDAFQFHTFRLMQSVEKASTREQEREFRGEDKVLDSDAFVRRLGRALERLRAVLSERPLHWGHGHVKPIDVFRYPGGERWALTDFGHTKMLPDGYEPAFAIWWDRLVQAAPDDYGAWRAGIEAWSESFLARFDELDRDVLEASLLERSLATVLDDLVLSGEYAADERAARLALHERLIDELS
jgi:hypothetical protein